MIAKKIKNTALPKGYEVTLVSPIKKSAFMLAKHLAARAKLIHVLNSPILFSEGAPEMIALLLGMHKAGAEPNQCVLMVDLTDRDVLFDTMSLWNNWGGVSVPVFKSVDHTLELIESELKSGNLPAEMSWIYE